MENQENKNNRDEIDEKNIALTIKKILTENFCGVKYDELFEQNLDLEDINDKNLLFFNNIERVKKHFSMLFNLLNNIENYGFLSLSKENGFYAGFIFPYYIINILNINIYENKHIKKRKKIGHKYLLELYKNGNNGLLSENLFLDFNEKIIFFLKSKGINIDLKKLKKQDIANLLYIAERKKDSYIDDSKKIIGKIGVYLSFLLTTSNILSKIDFNLKTLDDLIYNKNKKKINVFFVLSIDLFICIKMIINDLEKYNTNNVRKILLDNLLITQEKIEILENSYLYIKYILKNKITNPKVIQIFIENKELFINNRNIPYQKLFDLISNLEDEKIISKISDFLKNRSIFKINENILVILVENIIKTDQIFDEENINLIAKYTKIGVKYEDLMKLGMDLVQEVDKLETGDKKKIIKELLKDPKYLIKQETKKIKDEIENNMVYLNDLDPGKTELNELLKEIENISLDDLKIKYLTINIKYDIKQKVLNYKKIFKNDKENIKEKFKLYNKLKEELIYLDNFEEIILLVFSFKLEEIKDIYEISKKIYFEKNINIEDFKDLIIFLLNKENFVKNLDISGKIKIDEFNSLIDSKNIKERFITSLKSIYSNDLYEILNIELGLENENINIEKVSLIIDIGSKIPDNFKEDFVLHLEGINIHHLKFLYEIISLFKFLNINHIYSFSEYLNIKVNFENLDYLKEINNETLEKITNKEEFKKIIINFLNSGNKENIEKYLQNLENNEENLIGNNELDQKILEILLDNNEIEKEKLVNKINLFLQNLSNSMHPSQTTSTSNFGFGRGSGSYSEVILNYIIKKLFKDNSETNQEYLKRILKLNFTKIINLNSINDINGSHELKCLYSECEKYTGNEIFYSFLEKLGNIIGNIKGEYNIDLTELKKYYNECIQEEFKKIKRSLDI